MELDTDNTPGQEQIDLQQVVGLLGNVQDKMKSQETETSNF